MLEPGAFIFLPIATYTSAAHLYAVIIESMRTKLERSILVGLGPTLACTLTPSQPAPPSQPLPASPSQPAPPSQPLPASPSQPAPPSQPLPANPSQPAPPSQPLPASPQLDLHRIICVVQKQYGLLRNGVIEY